MVHKPKHTVHSFRGLLADDGQDEINLERQNVNLAYRMIKFEIIPEKPGGLSAEHVMQVWREEQNTTSIDYDEIKFTDPDLLAAGFVNNATGGDTYPSQQHVIFDNILFSRNIYVTMGLRAGTGSCNYYIEIEEVPVNAATLMQLKLGVARKLNLSQNPT